MDCIVRLQVKIEILDYPQFSDHYFTGEYPIKPSDNIKGLKVKQLSLLSEVK